MQEVDVNHLNELKNIGAMINDETFYPKMIESFVKSVTDSKLQLEGALSTDNYQDIKFYAHKIKGSATTVGAKKLYEIAAQVEDACADPDPNLPSKSEVVAIISEIEKVVSFLGPGLNRQGTKT